MNPEDDLAVAAVTVCVPTYRRPHLLATLIPSLVAQCDEARSDGHPASVLVIDNDPDQSARAVVQECPGVTYSFESTPGLAAVRNHALDRCQTRLLAFIDDDEVPTEGWLTSLLGTWRDTGAEAVTGQVHSRFPETLDPWIEAGDFWRRPSSPTGTVVSIAASGNLLLDVEFVRAAHLRFSEHFALTGGEDSFFSAQFTRAGGRIVCCNESIALDIVPPARTTKAWLRQRRLRSGNTVARVALMGSTPGQRGTRVLLGVRGMTRVAAGGLRWTAGVLLRSHRHQARGFSIFYRGVGMTAGAAGLTLVEYDRNGPRWRRDHLTAMRSAGAKTSRS